MTAVPADPDREVAVRPPCCCPSGALALVFLNINAYLNLALRGAVGSDRLSADLARVVGLSLAAGLSADSTKVTGVS